MTAGFARQSSPSFRSATAPLPIQCWNASWKAGISLSGAPGVEHLIEPALHRARSRRATRGSHLGLFLRGQGRAVEFDSVAGAQVGVRSDVLQALGLADGRVAAGQDEVDLLVKVAGQALSAHGGPPVLQAGGVVRHRPLARLPRKSARIHPEVADVAGLAQAQRAAVQVEVEGLPSPG